MQKIHFGSPAKENQQIAGSPTKKRKADPLTEVINYLKSNGINLPAHISKLIANGNPQSPLKLNINNKQDVEEKRLRVQLSECQFQLKKVEEDYAEYKRMTKIEREKESKKSEESINKLKNSLEQCSEDGAYNIQKIRNQYESDIKSLRQRCKLELEQELSKLQREYKTKLQSEEKLHKRELLELQRSSNENLHECKKHYEQQLIQIRKTKEDEIKELSMKNKNIIEEKEKRFQSIRVALESQKKTQEKLHQKAKIEFKSIKEKFITQLCFEQNVKRQQQEEIQSKEKQIRRLKSCIKDLEVQIQLKEQKYQKKITQIQGDYHQRYIQFEKCQHEQLKMALKEHELELQKYQQQLSNIEDLHKQTINLFKGNIQQISQNFEKRPSKKQDLGEIEKLKWALTRREEQTRKLARDLKHCNLQLENKEDIYTRIFRGNSMSREKRTNPKEDREQFLIDQRLGKDTIFRKSQTADVKFLLKIYNNTKNG